MKKSYFKSFLKKILFLFIIIGIILSPENAYKSALEGLNLWYNAVCPALLPFFICLEVLIKLGVINIVGIFLKPITQFLFNIPGEGAFAFIMSIASGYPVGAKVVADLRKKEICTQNECQRMISLCSTSGPLFIMGAVSVGILKNPALAPILLLSHYCSAITIGFIMRYYKKEKNKIKIYYNETLSELFKRDNKIEPLGQILVESVINSIDLILMIGGYIIFFSVISGIIKQINIINSITNLFSLIPLGFKLSSDVLSVFIIGILEVTNGIKECVTLNSTYLLKVAMVSFFIGFGGLSINAQVAGIIYETDINFSLYLVIKIIQGAVASFYSILLLSFKHIPVFKTYDYQLIYIYLLNKSILKLSMTLMLASFLLLFAILLTTAIYILITKKFKLN